MLKQKILTIAVLSSISLGSVGPVLANDDQGDDKVKVKVETGLGLDLKDLNEFRREEIQMLKELYKEKKQEMKEERQKKKLLKTWKKIQIRIGNVIKGQEEIAVKIDTRLDAMASNSINIEDLRAKLSTAVSLINTSKTA